MYKTLTSVECRFQQHAREWGAPGQMVKNKATVADNRPRFRLARRSALRTFPQTELAMIWIVTWAIREPGMLDVVASRNLVASLPLASDQLTEAMVRNYLKRLLSTVFAEGGC